MRLERSFFIWNCTLVVVGFFRPVVSIDPDPRIKELEPVHIDEVPIILSARSLVLPGLSALAPLQLNAAAFVEEFARDFSSPPKRLNSKPLRAFLEFAIFVFPALGTGDGKLRN
jgi:hypothetical protein